MNRLRSHGFGVGLSLLSASCGAQSCSKAMSRAPASASASAATPTRANAITSAATAALDPCALELQADRDATQDELLRLLLPALRSGKGLLPVQHPPATGDRPDVAGVFLVQPCRGEALESLSPPVIGQVQRLPQGDGRELVQFPVGTKEGLDEYTVGVLAVMGREGHTLRALDISEAAADLPGGLTPFRRARVGDAELLLRSEATNPAGEDAERGNYVSIDFLRGNELRLVGVIWEHRASDVTFWQGAFDWEMTSPGVEQTETGFVVRERWSFVHRKTQRRSSREVLRLYTVVDHRLLADPLDDLDAWPETRSALTVE
jgi:hypothetical protein